MYFVFVLWAGPHPARQVTQHSSVYKIINFLFYINSISQNKYILVTLRERLWVIGRAGGARGSLACAGHRDRVKHLGLLGFRRRAEDVGVAVGRALGRGLGGQRGDLIDDVLHLVRESRRGCQGRVRWVRALEVPLELVDALERVYVAAGAGVLAADQAKGALAAASLLMVVDGGLVREREAADLADEARLAGCLDGAQHRARIQADVGGTLAGSGAAVQDVLERLRLQL